MIPPFLQPALRLKVFERVDGGLLGSAVLHAEDVDALRVVETERVLHSRRVI